MELPSLLETHPELCEEWDYETNELGPENYTKGSGKKVWWKCKRRGHSYLAKIIEKTGGNGCPCCSGHLVCDDNCLANNDDHNLSAEWDYEVNGELTPKTVVYRSHKKIGWKCIKRGHKWYANLYHRQKHPLCPQCRLEERSLAANDRYGIVSEWHPTLNEDLTPLMVTFAANIIVWWLCKYGHKWQASVSSRNSSKRADSGCPHCNGTVDNCLAIHKPEHSAEWHPTKNGDLTPYDVAPSSGKDRWWLCKYGHEWCTSPHSKIGCPFCAGYRACIDNCLATHYPELAALWHPTKNGDLTPYDVTPGSHQYAWWICRRKGHERYAPIYAILASRGSCVHCHESKGEALIRHWLKAHGYEFECQKTYDGLVDKRKLKLDFVVQVGSWTLVIEIDGRQHFDASADFGAQTRKRDFAAEVEKDLKKTRFARDQGMCLLRISHLELPDLSDYLSTIFALLETAEEPFAIFSNEELYYDHIKIWNTTKFCINPSD